MTRHSSTSGVDQVRAGVAKRGLDSAPAGVSWDVPELCIRVDGDFAVAWGLNRMEAQLADGTQIESWSRGTRVFARRDGQWTMFHQHVSYPLRSPHRPGQNRFAALTFAGRWPRCRKPNRNRAALCGSSGGDWSRWTLFRRCLVTQPKTSLLCGIARSVAYRVDALKGASRGSRSGRRDSGRETTRGHVP